MNTTELMAVACGEYNDVPDVTAFVVLTVDQAGAITIGGSTKNASMENPVTGGIAAEPMDQLLMILREAVRQYEIGHYQVVREPA